MSLRTLYTADSPSDSLNATRLAVLKRTAVSVYPYPVTLVTMLTVLRILYTKGIAVPERAGDRGQELDVEVRQENLVLRLLDVFKLEDRLDSPSSLRCWRSRCIRLK